MIKLDIIERIKLNYVDIVDISIKVISIKVISIKDISIKDR